MWGRRPQEGSRPFLAYQKSIGGKGGGGRSRRKDPRSEKRKRDGLKEIHVKRLLKMPRRKERKTLTKEERMVSKGPRHSRSERTRVTGRKLVAADKNILLFQGGRLRGGRKKTGVKN